MRILVAIAAAVLLAAQAAPAGDVPVGTGNADRVVFYGDKLVDPPGFGYMVESFIRVKYPDAKSRFWHVGLRGFEKVSAANAEFDRLVAPLKPTVVVLCWGIGDGEIKKHSDERVARFTDEFDRLLDRCLSLGAKVYALTPPCPSVEKKNILAVNEFDVTILKIAEAITSSANQKGATVLDWYAPTAQMHQDGKGAQLTEKDGLYPSPNAGAIATKLILDAWHLETIDVKITVDWDAMTASTTHGQAQLKQLDDHAVLLDLQNLPMPFHTGTRKAAFNRNLACAEYCRVTLQIENIPGSTVVLKDPGSRRKPTRVTAKILRQGYDLAAKSPVSRNRTFTDFAELIENKNKAFSSIERFRKQSIVDNPPEPELVESYKTHLLSRKQYHEGMVKVLARTPRTIDMSLEIRTSGARNNP